MWKFVLVLLLTMTAILIAQLIRRCAGDPDAIQTRVATAQVQLTSAYAEVLG